MVAERKVMGLLSRPMTHGRHAFTSEIFFSRKASVSVVSVVYLLSKSAENALWLKKARRRPHNAQQATFCCALLLSKLQSCFCLVRNRSALHVFFRESDSTSRGYLRYLQKQICVIHFKMVGTTKWVVVLAFLVVVSKGKMSFWFFFFSWKRTYNLRFAGW